MIRAILFAVFFILLVIAIAGIALFAFKAHKVQVAWDEVTKPDRWSSKAPEVPTEVEKDYNRKMLGAKAGLISTIVAGIALLGLVICVPGSVHQVDTGTVAVVRHLGKIEGMRQPGTYFDLYMTNHYEVYDTKVQQDHILTAAYSKDGQTMELEVFLQYQVQSENIMKIATEYGSLEALQSRIETQTIEKTKAVMSSDIAMNIIQKRAEFSTNVSEAVREGISADYYVNVRDVVLTNIDFTDEFEKSVEAKVIAEQEKQAAITKAEGELAVAKLEAQKKIEQARGDAEAQKIIAKAAAEAATYNIIELARTVGYTVNEIYIYSVDGLETEFDTKQVETETVIYLGTKYIIDTISGPGPDKFKSLVEDYLAYLEYLKVWNGELPQVVAGDDALSIIVPNN